MTTKLDKPLKREVDLNGVSFTVTISPEGVKIVEKGKRKGHELTWEQVIKGDLSLSQDLLDSIVMAKEVGT
jgi:hypothetical protein